VEERMKKRTADFAAPVPVIAEKAKYGSDMRMQHGGGAL